jgi:copper homeostasis protein
MTSQRLLEVCVDTPEGLLAALRGGADRIELCAALGLSGLTPSAGLMRLAARQARASYAMVRPRAGDFCYSSMEFDVMRGDIDAVRAAGLPGAVLGASRPSGELDQEMLAKLIAHAIGLRLTLHRAFDLTPDPHAALEAAIDLGFERVLTSGGAKTAPLGAARLRELADQAGERIVVMAGGGVTAETIPALAAESGLGEFHGSFKGPLVMNERARALGFVNTTLDDTDETAVAAAVRALRAGNGKDEP